MLMDFQLALGPQLFKKNLEILLIHSEPFLLEALYPFPDEELNNIDPKDPNLLKNRPIIQRVIVISAGVFANLILAYSILIINVTTVGIPFDPEPGILVLATQPEKAASLAGLEPGDKILEIETSTLGVGDQAVSTLVKEIQNSSDEPISIKIERDGSSKI